MTPAVALAAGGGTRACGCYRGRMPTPDETAAERRRRAEEAVRAVAGGADLGEETQRLSNEFTDEWTSRITQRLRAAFRRR